MNVPVIALDLKIYGQWFTTEKGFLSMVANPTRNNRLPTRLGPVLFLFVATPSTVAYVMQNGSFFLSLFLFLSLASRPVLFKKSMKSFTVACWAFYFPLSFLALASTAYAQEAQGVVALGLALALCLVSVLVFLFMLGCSTLKMDTLRRNPILSFSSEISVSSNV